MGDRSGHSGFRFPAWTHTLGELIAEGATVEAYCSTCTASWPADLQQILAAKGPLYSLWNRTARCRTIGCAGKMWFKARRPRSGQWPVFMKDAPAWAVEPLHAAWRAAIEAAMIAPPPAQSRPLLAPPPPRVTVSSQRRPRGRAGR